MGLVYKCLVAVDGLLQLSVKPSVFHLLELDETTWNLLSASLLLGLPGSHAAYQLELKGGSGSWISQLKDLIGSFQRSIRRWGQRIDGVRRVILSIRNGKIYKVISNSLCCRESNS